MYTWLRLVPRTFTLTGSVVDANTLLTACTSLKMVVRMPANWSDQSPSSPLGERLNWVDGAAFEPGLFRFPRYVPALVLSALMLPGPLEMRMMKFFWHLSWIGLT